MIITRAITANILFDQNNDEIRSNQLFITGYLTAQNSQQIYIAGFLSQKTQTTSAISNPNINSTETTESTLPTEVGEISFPTSSALILDINIAPQVPTGTSRSKSDTHNDPNTSGKLPSQHFFLLKLSINFKFRTLQHYHFHNLLNVKGIYLCVIH